MELKIEPSIFEKYPTLNIGVVVVNGISNAGEHAQVLHLLNEQVDRIKSEYQLEALRDLPNMRTWREAYSSFGAKPKKYTCSVENLYRMILEGVTLKHINTLVDIYNYISLKYMVPVGGDDIDKLDGNIVLRFATGQEPFIRLNSDEIDHPKPGEVVYTDAKEVLCRRWNWRECDKTKMTEQTRNAMLLIEGLAPIAQADMAAATEELARLVKQFCGGKIATNILNVKNQ